MLVFLTPHVARHDCMTELLKLYTVLASTVLTLVNFHFLVLHPGGHAVLQGGLLVDNFVQQGAPTLVLFLVVVKLFQSCL